VCFFGGFAAEKTHPCSFWGRRRRPQKEHLISNTLLNLNKTRWISTGRGAIEHKMKEGKRNEKVKLREDVQPSFSQELYQNKEGLPDAIESSGSPS